MATMEVVEEIIDERSDGHGWWYLLKAGWKRDGYDCHSLRADTKQEINKQLKNEVVICNCAECLQALLAKPIDGL